MWVLSLSVVSVGSVSVGFGNFSGVFCSASEDNVCVSSDAFGSDGIDGVGVVGNFSVAVGRASADSDIGGNVAAGSRCP